MDQLYRMLFDEVRHALYAVRQQRYLDAINTMEDILAAERFIRRFRDRDPHAMRMSRVLRYLEWELTPEGRLELDRRRVEWERSPEWLRAQERLAEKVAEVRDADSAV